MEKNTKSITQLIRAGLIRSGHANLAAWARSNGTNYNTAYAALHGLRSGRMTKRVRKQLERFAHAA
jgi:hypothetical protein